MTEFTGIFSAGLIGNDALEGTQGDDTLYGNDGQDSTAPGDTDRDTLTGAGGHDLIYGDGGDDLIYGGHGLSDSGDGGDAIYGGHGNDSIYANGGNDTIDGGGEDDWLHGGFGNDLIDGGDGYDVIFGSVGADTIYGGGSNDTIYGGSSIADPDDAADTIYGGDGNDVIYGNGGDDLLIGGAGDDTLYGGFGINTLTGGAGNDVFYINDQGITDAQDGETTLPDPTAKARVFTAGDNQTIIITDFDASDTIRLNSTNTGLNFNDLHIGSDNTNPLVRIIDLPESNTRIEVVFSNAHSAPTLNATNVVVNGATPITPTSSGGGGPSNAPPEVDAGLADQTTAEDGAFAYVFAGNAFKDPEMGPLTYTATLSDNSALPAWLSFDDVTQTFSGTPLNADVGAITVRVTATDNSGATVYDDFDLTITNTNDAPVYANSSFSVPETIANGTTIGIASATDEDVGDTLTYAITAGNGAGIFAIDPVTGVLSVVDRSTLDFETGTNTHVLTVEATDSGALSDSATVTITITDVNETPVTPSDTDASANTIAENAANGTTVGITASATDPESTPITYSLTDNAGGRFAINTTTGVVSVADASLLDYESNTSHTITVSASDGVNAATQDFTIAVTNVNEAPGAIGDADAIANVVDENLPNGTSVGITAQAADPEGGAITYSLTDNAGGRFAINATTGVVTVANTALIDFELATSHTITVQASDGTLTSTQSFTIAIGDVTDLSVANLNSLQGYTEEVTLNLNDWVVTTAQANVTVTLTLSAAAAGSLTTATSNAVTSTYDAGTGVWSASGAIADVNALLAGVQLVPATNYESDFTIAMHANDGVQTLDGTLTLTGTGTNDAPTVANPLVDQFINETQGLSYTFAAGIFADIDAGDSLTYTATLEDGSALPGWLAFDGSARSFSATAGTAPVGDYRVKVTATDTGAATVSQVFTLAVAPVALYGTVNQDFLNGTAGDDIIIALDANDYVYGKAGNDTLYGNAGSDQIWGENGNAEIGSDVIYGGDGNDSVYADYVSQSNANQLADTVYGEAGNDQIWGYGGNDSLDGGADNDSIYGGLDNDTILGGAGNDSLYGEEGADRLNGGAGNDNFVYFNPTLHSATGNADIIEDFTSGQDKIWVVGYTAIGTAAPSGTVLKYSFDGAYTVITSANGFELKLLGNYTLAASDFQFLSIIGTPGDDTLNGDGGVNGILGLDGNDVIDSGRGNDLVWGDDGDDTIDGGVSWDTIYGGAGNDVFVMDYDTGGDIKEIDGSYIGHLIKDFTKGEDRIDVSAIPIKAFGASDNVTAYSSYDAATNITTVRWNGGQDYYQRTFILRLEGNISLDDSDFIFSNSIIEDTGAGEVLTGTAGDDLFYADNGNHTVYGDVGADIIHLEGSNNTVYGGDGYNFIWLRGSGDVIFGGDDQDVVYDYTTGGSPTYAFLGDGADFTRYLYGHVFFEGGNDSLYFQGTQASTLYGGDGNDILTNVAYGGAPLTVYGERGNDTLYMNYHIQNGIIYGGEGDDIVQGNDPLNSTLHGGYGADRFDVSSRGAFDQREYILYLDPNESTTTETDYFRDDNNNTRFDAGAEATSDQFIIYGFTGIAAGAASGTVLGFSFDGTYTNIVSSSDYSFKIRVQGDYTAADSDGNGEVFDLANNFEFRSGTLGTMNADTITGTTAGEFIFGLEGQDVISAGDGADSVFGGHDADVLNGEAGADSVSGGYADDTLNGGAGADTLEGGSGNDHFVFSSLTDSTAATADVIIDFKHGGDADKIDLTGLGITGIGAGATELTIAWNNDQYTAITHNNSTFKILLQGYYELGVDIDASDFIV